jgi:hypothetical protein
VRFAVRTRRLALLFLISIVGSLAGCGSVVSTDGGTTPAATAISSTTQVPRPCSFLTQAVAARTSRDAAVTNQATNVTETESGYVACIFADAEDEANSVEVQIKRVPGGVDPSTLRGAATFFSLGEPVRPYQTFSVQGVGDSALGETTPGVAFIVFSVGDLLIYVGGDSGFVSAASLRVNVENLAKEVAAAL